MTTLTRTATMTPVADRPKVTSWILTPPTGPIVPVDLVRHSEAYLELRMGALDNAFPVARAHHNPRTGIWVVDILLIGHRFEVTSSDNAVAMMLGEMHSLVSGVLKPTCSAELWSAGCLTCGISVIESASLGEAEWLARRHNRDYHHGEQAAATYLRILCSQCGDRDATTVCSHNGTTPVALCEPCATTRSS
ncbi:hypothetical protein ATK17_3794 [Branchiibius hedensis]|uniref:Uncharacterized protein n=1 Tax=Branchiibius hedensis TaxID=672460 RepID=A0A2Y9BLG5_9MICO|nr:hypothetical protein [Branchiibius hedensis]PWJ23300.1 hypothetical protein ATK17_3794 [Branchiibius hedensis]SSA58989.1 hypothetical protein SAMN04489750_3794 [Branchiibius hedensis]